MKLVWDSGRCQRHGRCYMLAAEVVDCADDGYPIVPDGELPAEAVEDAQLAVENCPEQALRLAPAR